MIADLNSAQIHVKNFDLGPMSAANGSKSTMVQKRTGSGIGSGIGGGIGSGIGGGIGSGIGGGLRRPT